MTSQPELEEVVHIFDENESADDQSLYQAIDRLNVHGLNLEEPEQAKSVIKPWNLREDIGNFAQSQEDVDDQIVIHVPFVENVHMDSLHLKLASGEFCPRRLRLYANRPHIVDFSEAEDIKPHLDIALRQDDRGVVSYPLRAGGRFANVHSISLFFSNSAGGDSTKIFYIGFKGHSRFVKKDTSSKLDIPAATAPDVKLYDRLQEKSGGQQTTAR
ncbi:hypothetical protein QCA50_007677 [Cerrena zonata]|uniref:PITH domain-containing protein n=1 Tax=Cerrena zonata TaxID=2478898 RepID=A0AAW0G6K8_9APHY